MGNFLKKNSQPLDVTMDVIIIGAGPAGLFTALNLKRGPRVLILEKNQAPGRKLLVSGSGRCNFTHAGEIDLFFDHYGDNHRFLKTALKTFSNNDLIQFFKHRHLLLTIDENGKVFPHSGQAVDILNILVDECKKNQVIIHSQRAVLSIENQENRFLVDTSAHRYYAKTIVIATGGQSYPSTGSTGDGYRFAQSLGHTLISPQPALTPVFIKNYPFADLSGLSLANRTIDLFRDHRKITSHTGDIGFTHKGLSGPGILDFSRYFHKNDLLQINLVNLGPGEFSRLFIETTQTQGKISIKRFLKAFDLPDSLVKSILQQLAIDPQESLARIDKKKRSIIVEAFCQYSFIIEKTGGFPVAMVTRGGIPLHEVSSKTMESKLVKNLFFAGEVLDIDGDTGGYNIQAAFSTAYLAAQAINFFEK